jgi:hypothetical protein
MTVSSLCCVLDIRNKKFGNAMIGGFQILLLDNLSFATIYSKYFVALEYPYIYEVLKYYILPAGFDMHTKSCIIPD